MVLSCLGGVLLTFLTVASAVLKNVAFLEARHLVADPATAQERLAGSVTVDMPCYIPFDYILARE
jgi:hypothetical protein